MYIHTESELINTAMLSMGTTDDPIYQQFYNTTKNNNIGKFQQIKTLVNNTTVASSTNSIRQATTINQSITTKSLIENNQQVVNAIYLKEKAHNNDTANAIRHRYKYDAGELATLNNIAYQNPKMAGNAVFMARAMLGIIVFDNDSKEKSLRKKTISPQKQNRIESYKLYPNPNNGEMQFTYQLSKDETGVLKIYDAQVENVGTYNLISGINILNINETQLLDGVYFYAVFVNNKKVFGDKFVISK